MEHHIDQCCHKPELKRPCRCGGRKFVEPKMKITNCFPQHCKPECCGCRCCCECKCPCCDAHPCRCGQAVCA